MPTDEKIVIGLDYGCTYTGVAFAYSGTPDDIEVIKTWPGSNGITSDKTPSELSYEPASVACSSRYSSGETSSLLIDKMSTADAASGIFKSVRWGFQLKPGEERIRGLKLFLQRDIALPSFVSTAEVMNQLRDNNATPVKAVADYLREVRSHTMKTLSNRLGQTFVRNTPLELIITVPAIWSDKAKDATLQAARLSGFDCPIKVTTEPEAAAVYTLKAIRPNNIRVGDHVLVCDCGGGTIDLITYSVTQLSPTVEVKESLTGVGDLCGSAFLNQAFEELIESKFGDQKFRSLKHDKPMAWYSAARTFELDVKRMFNDEDLEDINIPFPGVADDAQIALKDGFLTLSHEEIKSIFEPIVCKVLALVETQIAELHATDELVSAIVLVGGFGQSSYLLARMQNHFSSNHPPAYSETTASSSNGTALPSRRADKEIIVMQPQNSWTAVVRGAVLRGLDGTLVTERICRFHYGVAISPSFNRNEHPESIKYWDDLDGVFRACGWMKWLVRKGEKVSIQRAIKISLQKNFTSPNFRQQPYVGALLACRDEDAHTIQNDDLLKVCELRIPLGNIPRRHFRKCTSPKGKTYWKLGFDIQLTIDSAHLEFELVVDDISYGSVTPNFDHEGGND